MVSKLNAHKWTEECYRSATYICVESNFCNTIGLIQVIDEYCHLTNTILNYIDTKKMILRFKSNSGALNRAENLFKLLSKLKLVKYTCYKYKSIHTDFIKQCSLEKLQEFNSKYQILSLNKVTVWTPYHTYLKVDDIHLNIFKEIYKCEECKNTPCFMVCSYCGSQEDILKFKCYNYSTVKTDYIFKYNCKCEKVQCNTCNGRIFNPLHPLVLIDEYGNISDTKCEYKNGAFYLANGEKKEKMCICHDKDECFYWNSFVTKFEEALTYAISENNDIVVKSIKFLYYDKPLTIIFYMRDLDSSKLQSIPLYYKLCNKKKTLLKVSELEYSAKLFIVNNTLMLSYYDKGKYHFTCLGPNLFKTQLQRYIYNEVVPKIFEHLKDEMHVRMLTILAEMIEFLEDKDYCSTDDVSKIINLYLENYLK